jgi:hypothetical protein
MHGSTMHPDDESLSALLDGQVPPGQVVTVRAHLAECDECQSRLLELEGVVHLLRSLPELDVPRDFTIGPRLTAPSGAVWPRRIQRWYTWSRVAASSLAAAFVVLLAAEAYVGSVNSTAVRPVQEFSATSVTAPANAPAPTPAADATTAPRVPGDGSGGAVAPRLPTPAPTQPQAVPGAANRAAAPAAAQPASGAASQAAPPPPPASPLRESAPPAADLSTQAAEADAGVQKSLPTEDAAQGEQRAATARVESLATAAPAPEPAAARPVSVPVASDPSPSILRSAIWLTLALALAAASTALFLRFRLREDRNPKA